MNFSLCWRSASTTHFLSARAPAVRPPTFHGIREFYSLLAWHQHNAVSAGEGAGSTSTHISRQTVNFTLCWRSASTTHFLSARAPAVHPPTIHGFRFKGNCSAELDWNSGFSCHPFRVLFGGNTTPGFRFASSVAEFRPPFQGSIGFFTLIKYNLNP